MSGNPNWWGMAMSPPPSPPPPSSSSSLFPPPQFSVADQPLSWSQLLGEEEDKAFMNQTFQSHFRPIKKLENWDLEHQIFNTSLSSSASPTSSPSALNANFIENFINNDKNNPFISTSDHNINFLNFSSSTPDYKVVQCSTDDAGGACKKARVHLHRHHHPPASSQPPLKVRKEKLVDRITTLHQIVSPFGKTDTASVLSEAIGYIRFLEAQIEALTTPPKNIINPQYAPALVLKAGSWGEKKELKSRGLCLVPLISCTQLLGNISNGPHLITAASPNSNNITYLPLIN